MSCHSPGSEAHPFERTRPFGRIAAALGLRRQSRDPRRAAIGRLLAGDPESSRTVPGGISDLRHALVEEILDLVELAGTRSPVMVVLEDLHWGDGPTIKLVDLYDRC